MSKEEVAALSVEGLTAGYGGPPIIEQVSISARRGAAQSPPSWGRMGQANPRS